MRGLSLVRPFPPSSAPRRGTESTSDTIIIEWEEAEKLETSGLSSLFFYKVDYTLERPSGSVDTNSMVVS